MVDHSYESFRVERDNRKRSVSESKDKFRQELAAFHMQASIDRSVWKDRVLFGLAYQAAMGITACSRQMEVLGLQELLADDAREGHSVSRAAEAERLREQLLLTLRPGTTAAEREQRIAEGRLRVILNDLVEVQEEVAIQVETLWARLQREALLNGGSAAARLIRWEKQKADELQVLLAPLLTHSQGRDAAPPGPSESGLGG